jgi:hypothetical protein
VTSQLVDLVLERKKTPDSLVDMLRVTPLYSERGIERAFPCK